MHPNSHGPYGIQLLDDLHTYFPAILYNPERFFSVRSMLEYIQTCARERFDIFTNNSNNYIRYNMNNATQQNTNDNYRNWFNATSSQQPAATAFPSRSTRNTSSANNSNQHNQQTHANIYQYAFPSESIYTFTPGEATVNDRDTQLLTSILGLFASPSGTSFLDPIPVYPTTTQINQASTVRTANNTDDENNCSICRENFIEGEELRNLNNCSHTFHKVCIDQWFRTNVHCPICRDDIRVLRHSTIRE
jgi:hypothetical protein